MIESIDHSSDSDALKSKIVKHGRNYRTRTRKHNGGPHISNINEFVWKSPNLTLTDVQAVANQLGYLPKNIIEVTHRTSDGVPISALLYPLNFNESCGRYSTEIKPFPTIMWITNPSFKSRISRLECDGWVARLQERLSTGSSSYILQMKSAHENYAKLRHELLSISDIEMIKEKGWMEAFSNVGIAGIGDFTQVKCLHCHYAHFVSYPSHGNIIGQWVHELLTNNEK